MRRDGNVVLLGLLGCGPHPQAGPSGSPLFAELTGAGPRFGLLKFHPASPSPGTVSLAGGVSEQVQLPVSCSEDAGPSSGTGG